MPICEEIVCSEHGVAIRTENANYFSLGVNLHGCAFASTAVNSPKWTQAVLEGRLTEAKEIFEEETRGHTSPTKIVSEMLPHVATKQDWIKRLTQAQEKWMGYNVIVADKNGACVVETFGERTHVRELKDCDVITNHFLELPHGPKKITDYPSTFERLNYAQGLVSSCQSIDDIFEVIKPQDTQRQKQIWRSGVFKTQSSAVIEIAKTQLWHSTGLDEDYKNYLQGSN